MFFYSDTKDGGTPKVDIWRMNGTKAYLRHYDNLLFLDFMAKNGTRVERHQAEKEMVICRRKLKFWENHPNYNHEEALKGISLAKKQWTSK